MMRMTRMMIELGVTFSFLFLFLSFLFFWDLGENDAEV